MADRSGEQFGQYQLVHFLKGGGFGEVYEATHPSRCQVALKLLNMQPDERGLPGFLNDVRAVLLNHPHIIKILDFGVEGQTPYLAMPYLVGGSLRVCHPRGDRLPLHCIVDYVQQIAEALQYAHDHGIIHRDVKPENILLGPDGKLVLADFGIAVVFDQRKTHEKAEFAGTPTYAAPEQFQDTLSPASDQYALGTMVYEWLMGDMPFHGTSPTALALQKTQNPPPPLPGIAPALEHVVRKALATDPKDRYPSVQTFATELEQASLLDQPTISSISVSTPPPAPVPVPQHANSILGTVRMVPTPPPAPVPVQSRTHKWWVRGLVASLAVVLLVSGSLVGLSLPSKRLATRPALGTIKEFTPPNCGRPALFGPYPCSSHGITKGPDGNLWFTECTPILVNYVPTECSNSSIGRITPTGQITEFPLPTGLSFPYNITAGPDGNLWFTDLTGGRIGRITPTGQISEFTLSASSSPDGITKGPDGNLWFTECTPVLVKGVRTGCSNSSIGRITTDGKITEFPLPMGNSDPHGITTGPDGTLWFTEYHANKIGSITPKGGLAHEFALLNSPEDITKGPDGNLWFTEQNSNKIGRITPYGLSSEFAPSFTAVPKGITTGPDGNLWFTVFVFCYSSGCFVNSEIGRIMPDGLSREFGLPYAQVPEGITTGPDGNLWFTTDIGKIGWISPGL